MKYITILLGLIFMVGCTTITKGDFSYISTKDVSVEYIRKTATEVEIQINTKSTGKKELMQGFIEAIK